MASTDRLRNLPLALICVALTTLVGCPGGGSSGTLDVEDSSAADGDTSPEDTSPQDTSPEDTSMPDVCIPDCAGKSCGEDGCGGSCAPGCASGEICDASTFTCVCVPNCAGLACGTSCGVPCGQCTAPAVCNSAGQCVAPANDCAGEADGTPCATGICLGDACVASQCGDGFVDGSTGEVCDDGNMMPGDGCEPSCQWTCSDDTHCALLDDGNPCNGSAVCNTGSHLCETTAPLAAGAACSAPSGAGTCQDLGGLRCVAAGCGNGVVDTGEDCDDSANANPNDGCRPDCTFTCDQANDPRCNDGDLCNGMETCNLGSHTCQTGTPLNCTPPSSCYTSSCQPAQGCVDTLIDNDGDGHAPSTLGGCGIDCNDNNPAMHGDHSEICNDGLDNDCNGTADDGLTIWYADCDGDGFAAPGATQREDCNLPTISTGCAGSASQWVSLNPNGSSGSADCCDGDSRAHPGQTNYYPSPRACGGFDYNCSGGENKAWTSLLTQCGYNISSGCGTPSSASGWYASSAPACGTPGNWVTNCHQTGSTSCGFDVSGRIQQCR